MKTALDFRRSPPEQGQMPLATSRLANQWLGKKGGNYATR
jgi:hypothetical protein